MNGNRGLDLENICSKDDNKNIYWFGFGTFEYSDEYINNGNKLSKHKNIIIQVMFKPTIDTQPVLLIVLSRCDRCQSKKMCKL